LSRQCVGALVAIERRVPLAHYAKSGEALDSVLSPALLQAVFCSQSPLHDGAVVLCQGRVIAAACQLPLGRPPEGSRPPVGMRHRAAVCLSQETDAVLLVISEETGRISLAVDGKLEPVPRDNLSRRLAALLSQSSPTVTTARAA
jgi:diadenylate cyclase